MEFSTTQAVGTDRLNIAVYGPPGAGKTSLAATTGDLPRTLLIDAEAGALSLRGHDIARAVVHSVDDVRAAFSAIMRDPSRFRWIVIDSITQIAEWALADAKKATKDGRQAYGIAAETVAALIRAFQLLHCHVVFIAQQEVATDETGRRFIGPAMPGRKLAEKFPRWFDIVAALRVEQDAEGAAVRYLQTVPVEQWTAKDRSGALDARQQPNLREIARKIGGDASVAVDDDPKPTLERNQP